MDSKLIAAFTSATVRVLRSMASTESTPGKPKLKGTGKTAGILTGVAGLAGKTTAGCFVLSFDAGCLLSIVNKMRAEQYIDLNPDVVDAVGELTHLIASEAARELMQGGEEIYVSTPLVLTGQNVDVKQLSKTPVTSIQFETSSGRFAIELG